MNRNELLQRLTFLEGNDGPVGIVLYFVIEDGNNTMLRTANIDDQVGNDLLNQFLEYINSKFINNDDLIFSDLTNADDRRNSAYYYNLGEKPERLEVLQTVLNEPEQPIFNFNQNELSSIKAFIMTIGNAANKLAIYKKHYPINLLKRDAVLRIFPANERFEKLDTNVLNINETFEFMQIENDLIVLSLKVLETNFGYEDIVRGKATDNLALIEASGLLDSIDLLTNLAGELKYAKKIVRIKHDTPVLQLPVNTVINFVTTHPMLRRRIRLTADNSRISLDTKVSQELFLKLLNDDFLKSELTNLLYESPIKDTVSTEEV